MQAQAGGASLSVRAASHAPQERVHPILHAHLIPKCPHADLFNARSRAWLAAQQLPDDECAAIDRHVRELDRFTEDLALLDCEIAQDAMDDPAVNRLITITGVNLRSPPGSWRRSATSAGSTARTSWELFRAEPAGAAVPSSERPATAASARSAAVMRAPCWSTAWAAANAPGSLHALSSTSTPRRGHQIAAVAVARKLTVLCWHLLTNR
ncbi:hypothetical protein ACVWZV_009094 [Bradyrhizobium sp. GM5.1]|uniref:hypothetical protein n=1 Tax=unclassified Bradyrhizobium TaxID=2631580 RepID=UPI001FFB8346|nr:MULTISPECIES: hypothetical protein [unclassified Bradyrhizobium]